MKNKILVTGASGFVGGALCLAMKNRGINHRGVFRKKSVNFDSKFDFLMDAIDDKSDWTTEALIDIDTVVHCAGVAHLNASDDCMKIVNVDGTLNLARQAAESGVRRFVFISSIGVNGSETFVNPFTEEDTPNPQTKYASYKLDAENGLKLIADEFSIEIVIIRPPLVYGFNAPGNFGRLLMLINKWKFLPFGSINNKRSFVALENLVDLIILCCNHPAAANQVFLAGDGEDISISELFKKIGAGKDIKLLPVPVWLLYVLSFSVGKYKLMHQLCANLQIDITKSKTILNWTPPVSFDDSLSFVLNGENDAKIF